MTDDFMDTAEPATGDRGSDDKELIAGGLSLPRKTHHNQVAQSLEQPGSSTVQLDKQVGTALDYHRRGLATITVPRAQKNPRRSGWQDERFNSEGEVINAFSRGPRNIGVRLGEASGGCVDVDIDDPLTTHLADKELPVTESVFGRAGKRRSHRLYKIDEPMKSAKFVDPIPAKEGGLGTIIEIRSQSNQLTIMPGSLHGASGELVEWDSDGPPAQVKAEELHGCVAEVASRRILKHHWPGEGARHEPALAFAGATGRAGWQDAKISEWLKDFWPTAEPGQIDGVIRTTREKLESGDAKVTGWPRLEEHINPAVVRKVREWLRLNSEATNPANTDMGNGERFVDQHGGKFRYCAELGGWYTWDARCWQSDKVGQVRESAKETIRSIPDEVRNEQDFDKRKAALKWALRSENGRGLDNMLAMARSVEGIAVTPEQFDRHPWLFNVVNGTIDLKTMNLREANPADHLTKVAPVAYVPGAECPHWMAHIQRSFSLLTEQGLVRRPELEGYFQRWVGYMLTGDTSEKSLLILYGPGDTGKTVTTEILLDLMGEDYAMTTAESTIAQKRGNEGIPNDLAALRGARLVIVSETSEGMRLNEGRIKALTGRNRIAARFLNHEWFNYIPEFKLLIETNHRPQISGTDTAIWNRVKPLPFLNVLTDEERDPELPEKLRAELPGILNWALEGCVAWQRDGLGEPDLVREANSEYRDQSDRLKQFLEDRCDLSNPDSRERTSTVYEEYRLFCETRGFRPLNNQRFSVAMQERGFETVRLKGYPNWKGVALREPEPTWADGFIGSGDTGKGGE